MSADVPDRFPAAMREAAAAAAAAGLTARPLPEEVISLRHPDGRELAILWQQGPFPCLATADLRELGGMDRVLAWIAGVDVTSSGC